MLEHKLHGEKELEGSSVQTDEVSDEDWTNGGTGDKEIASGN